VHLRGLPDDELGASATDVDGEVLAVEHGHRLQDAEVDEPCFFDAGDDLDLDARFVPRAPQEVLAVRCLAYGAGCDGDDARVVAVGDLAEAPERLDAAIDRGGIHLGHVARPVPEPDRLLLPGQHVEAAVVPEPGDDEMDRVGADVDGGADRVLVVQPLPRLGHPPIMPAIPCRHDRCRLAGGS
jgi:hypothetical protein